ncbi:helix-turn-helix domain-containing protein [Alpinimonas psychrophila]
MHNAVDLISTLLHEELGLRVGSSLTRKQSALMAHVNVYIDGHLLDPSLRPPYVARASYTSTRYLHAIFLAQGVSVSTWICILRLSRCYRDLLDPLLVEISISATANRWGFTDSSQCRQVFRKSCRESARDIRKRTSLSDNCTAPRD